MHYIPILKDKAAEFGALAELADDVKFGLTPLFDLLPLGPSQDPDQWISRTAKNLEKSWKISRPVYVDGLQLGTITTSKGGHALSALVTACNNCNINIVPVTGLGRAQAGIREVVRARPAFGLCLRLSGQDFGAEFPASGIAELLKDLGATEESADLLLDFGVITADIAGLIATYIQSIPAPGKWRTLTVAATSFPEHLGEFGPESEALAPRLEWNVWQALLNSKLPRKPQFSDYGIQHPKLVTFEPQKMTVSAQLRYTTDTAWLIVRGRSIKKHGYAQMHGLCKKVIARSEFKGADFSAGDEWIDKCAARKVSPGVPRIWRKIGTVHHLTMVVRKLAKLAAA